MGALAQKIFTAFEGSRRIGTGPLSDVALQAKEVIDGGAQVLIFDDVTGEQIELDFRGTSDEVRGRLEDPGGAAPSDSASAGDSVQRGPGRPKLGVVAREVTLLPRHWNWLNSQPGGASVALRKLVEEARRVHAGRDRVRQSQETAYRFMSAMAGNLPGFEEAARALFAGQELRFEEMTTPWPADIREHARKLAAGAFGNVTAG
jgi:hypothetical protein